jgi:transcriptional repressor NrdR
MKCPFCSHLDNRVIDSRLSRDGDVTRRRRECARCERRFTTYERVEEIFPLVVKKDGRREPYDRLKVIAGLKKACEKRPISITAIEETADRIERILQSGGEKEISSAVIGEEVMRHLYDLDKVAYVRFASVYRSFQDLDAFMRELKDLISDRNGREKKRGRQHLGRRPTATMASKSR